MHVDEFVTERKYGEPNEVYARWVLHLFRLPAMYRMIFHQFISRYELYCNFEGKPYRVVGASRMGDIWLAADPFKAVGYDIRVDPLLCTQWRAHFEIVNNRSPV